MTEYLFLGGPADGQRVKIEGPPPDVRRVYVCRLWESANFNNQVSYETDYKSALEEDYFLCAARYRGRPFAVYTHKSSWPWDRIWETLIFNYRKPEERPI